MKHFDENIIKLIRLFAYKMYLIQPDEHIDCVCKDYNTKQGNPACQRCLGIGQKIKIRTIKGVRQPEGMGVGDMSVNSERGVYFVENNYKLREGDFIIWRGEIEQITKTERYCSDAEKPVYYYCETIRKKTNKEIFLKNFHRILNR